MAEVTTIETGLTYVILDEHGEPTTTTDLLEWGRYIEDVEGRTLAKTQMLGFEISTVHFADSHNGVYFNEPTTDVDRGWETQIIHATLKFTHPLNALLSSKRMTKEEAALHHQNCEASVPAILFRRYGNWRRVKKGLRLSGTHNDEGRSLASLYTRNAGFFNNQ